MFGISKCSYKNFTGEQMTANNHSVDKSRENIARENDCPSFKIDQRAKIHLPTCINTP